MQSRKLGDILTPIFSTIGFTVAQSEVLEYIFLSLTIISLAISIATRLYVGYKNIKAKYDKHMIDGNLSKEEIQDLADSVVAEAEAVKEYIEKEANK